MRLRKLVSLLLSRRAYHLHLEPRLFGLFDADAAFVTANLDLFKPLVPLPVPAPAAGPLLVLGAHPDDEAVGAGGTLLLARQKGVPISAAFLTDGRPGEGPDSEKRGEIRRAEALAAARMLGAEVRFFKARVRTLARDRALAREAVAWVRGLIEETGPRDIFCPFPLDAHSDHRLTAWVLARALEEALTGRAKEPIIWAYEVASLSPANALVEIGGVEDGKAALIETYSSQVAEFDYVNAALGLNRYHSRHLQGRGAAEAFFRVPARAFKDLMGRFSEAQLFKEAGGR